MKLDPKTLTGDQDIRLSLLLGIANWSLFLDHIPNNAVNWITARNYGFSGATDWFIFTAAYIAAIVYTRLILERGFIVGATRIFKRVWQLYAAYVVLFVIYIVTIAYVASQYAVPDIINEFNVAALIDHPIPILGHGLLLQSKPLNLDVLQLYTALMPLLAPVLWVMMRKPDLAMLGSVGIYLAAQHFGWSLSSYPDGDWYFNPFCWQLLFVFGAWIALGRVTERYPLLASSGLFYVCVAYLIFALVMTMAARFPAVASLLPSALVDTFIPIDKVNLSPYRVLHFAAALLVAARLVPSALPALHKPILDPLVVCGEHSLPVFCVGVFLSFIGNFALTLSSGSLLAQIMVSVSGVSIMTFVAYYTAWSRQQDMWKSFASA